MVVNTVILKTERQFQTVTEGIVSNITIKREHSVRPFAYIDSVYNKEGTQKFPEWETLSMDISMLIKGKVI